MAASVAQALFVFLWNIGSGGCTEVAGDLLFLITVPFKAGLYLFEKEMEETRLSAGEIFGKIQKNTVELVLSNSFFCFLIFTGRIPVQLKFSV